MIPGRIVFAFIDKNTNTFIPSPCTSHADTEAPQSSTEATLYVPAHYLNVTSTLSQSRSTPLRTLEYCRNAAHCITYS